MYHHGEDPLDRQTIFAATQGLRSLPVRQGEAASADFQPALASEVIALECRWRRGSDVQHFSDPPRMP